jgi:hypothetical protein
MIECRDAVRGNQQERIVDGVQIANFAAAQQRRVA